MIQKTFDKQHRLKAYDYSSSNHYMVTFNVRNRERLLSDIKPAKNENEKPIVELLSAGLILEKYILSIPDHYNAVRLEKYVIMPDHVHLLLWFTKNEISTSQSQSKLAKIVRALKSLTTKEIGMSIWQSDYYDCIANTQQKYESFWNYIEYNPVAWLQNHNEEPEL